MLSFIGLFCFDIIEKELRCEELIRSQYFKCNFPVNTVNTFFGIDLYHGLWLLLGLELLMFKSDSWYMYKYAQGSNGNNEWNQILVSGCILYNDCRILTGFKVVCILNDSANV